MHQIRDVLWKEPAQRPTTILAAHQHIVKLEHAKLENIFQGDLADACVGLKWLTQLQENMHNALESFMREHPGGRSHPTPLTLGLPGPLKSAVGEFGPSGLPALVMALATTASLCLFRHKAQIPLHEQSEVVKASSPVHDIPALRKLQEDSGGLAGALNQFCWYHTFFGLFFRTVTEADLSKPICCFSCLGNDRSPVEIVSGEGASAVFHNKFARLLHDLQQHETATLDLISKYYASRHLPKLG
jgi:hypothetical protein